MAESPTSRTLKQLRKDGWTAEVTERWISYARRSDKKKPDDKKGPTGVRHDLFGFIDVLAIHPEHGTLAVQTTSGSNLSSRVAKILAEDRAYTWLQAGRGFHMIQVWAWRKLKVKRGGKAVRWVPKIQEITTTDWFQDTSRPVRVDDKE